METDQQNNKLVHLQSLSLTKLGDGLVNPKLVLAWLLTSVGAGAGFVGLLVPVREAGALLPQLFTASKLSRVAVRKWWWVIGSILQGLAVFGIAVSGLLLEGQLAGVAIISFLALFALARSICSVSYKDVLGKTVEKSRRGLVTGTASSIAAGGVLLFGLLLMFEVVDRSLIVFGALFLASILWVVAGIAFSRLDESPSEIAQRSSESTYQVYKRYLFEDKELQKFLLVRGLLTATAVAPPFILLLASEAGQGGILAQLGAMVVATSFASFVSGRLWGSFSDYSTVLVLSLSGILGGTFLGVALIGVSYGWYATAWFLPLLIFVFMVVYEGVRNARTIHLVNLAGEETRAAYTAISNTVIGVVLILTGFIGVLAEFTSVSLVVSILSVMAFLGGFSALRLQRV